MNELTESKLLNLTKKQLVRGFMAYKRTVTVEINVSFNFNY
jgi:hypothetical protein